MAIQTRNGKAFEYACLKAIYDEFSISQSVSIVSSLALSKAKTFYEAATHDEINKMDKAAKAAIRVICRYEPQIENSDKNIPLYLSIQDDAQGIAGDVRDVICIRKQNKWEIGISCKHNHAAVKHSRLSLTIDFGLLWLNHSCSHDYFREIKPLFDTLQEMKNKEVLWHDIADKEDSIYVPLLNAFIKELKKIDSQYPKEAPPALVKYLLGRNDFYKVIAHDASKTTTLEGKMVNKWCDYYIYGILDSDYFDRK